MGESEMSDSTAETFSWWGIFLVRKSCGSKFGNSLCWPTVFTKALSLLLIAPFPVVWSPAGPVLGVSVGPDPLVQSNPSSAPCVQPHRPSSKEQSYVCKAEDANRCVKSVEPTLWVMQLFKHTINYLPGTLEDFSQFRKEMSSTAMTWVPEVTSALLMPLNHI